MTEPIAKLRLEDVIRVAETRDDLVFLLRAGDQDDNVERLQQQAGRLSRRYTLGGVECYGVSAFAATEASEAWVLATKMDIRRRYYRIRPPR
jgi:hypothetical protein